MDKHEWLGRRVALNYGVLNGELATVVPDNDGIWYVEEGDDEEVRIRFDRNGAHLGADKGHAILSDRWEYVEDLQVIE